MNKIADRFPSILPLALLAVFFVLFTRDPLWDPDFFWHMKTGEYILHHDGLPAEDTFSFTTPPGETLRKNFILRQYWLAQVIFSLLWQTAGVPGIVLLRALLLSLALFLVFLLLRRDVEPHLLSGVLFLSGVMLLDFTGDRPQLFSFTATALLFFILESYRKKGGKILYALPFLMCLWANLHGGVILGDALLVLYAVSEGVRLAAGHSGPGEGTYPKMLAFCLISVAASLLSPNTYHIFAAFYRFYGSTSMRMSPEFFSPVKIALRYGKIFWMYFCAVSLTVVAIAFALWRKRKDADFTRIAAVVFLCGIAMSSARYIVFFAIAFPLIFADVDALVRGRRKGVRVLVVACVIAVSCYFLWTRPPFAFSVSNVYPRRAVEFIRKVRPAGNLFNYFDWGGYLIATLPEYKVFIDGRGLDENVQVTYNLILSASTMRQNNRYEWQSLLDSYNVSVVLLPGRDYNTGDTVPLVIALMQDPQWRVGYADQEAIVFLRKTAARR